jgi:hypothetical protein
MEPLRLRWGTALVVERHADRRTARALHPVEAQVGRHTPHPRAEGQVGVEGVEALVGADKGLLCQVLGLAALAQQPVAHVEDGGLVTPDEFAKGLGVAAPGAKREGAVAGIRHACRIIQEIGEECCAP